MYWINKRIRIQYFKLIKNRKEHCKYLFIYWQIRIKKIVFLLIEDLVLHFTSDDSN